MMEHLLLRCILQKQTPATKMANKTPKVLITTTTTSVVLDPETNSLKICKCFKTQKKKINPTIKENIIFLLLFVTP